MFGWFKSDPRAKLQKQYEALMGKAVEAQRNGKIELYGQLSQEAEKVLIEIKKLEQSN